MMLYLLGRIAASNGGSGVASKTSASASWVRYFSRKRAENVRKINPRVTPQEASSIARSLYDIVKQRGPLTISSAWLHAKDSSVSGLNSKTHMKLMLKWMRGRKMLKLLCNHVGSTKKFLLSTLPTQEPKVKVELELEPKQSKNNAAESKLQTKKPFLKAPQKKQTR